MLPTQSDAARMLLEELLHVMALKVAEITSHPNQDTFVLRMRLEDISNYFRQSYSSAPGELVRLIDQCLQRERAEMAAVMASGGVGVVGGGGGSGGGNGGGGGGGGGGAMM